MTDRLRVVFAGTPDFAAGHLQALLDHGGHDVVAVYCQPDRPAGRGKKLTPGPVKTMALEAGIDVYQPLNFKSPATVTELDNIGADIMVVVAYGLLLPPSVLDTPRLGCINVHASLLPRWRGAAPIQRAIEAGDRDTGVTIMQMDAGLDTGPMLLRHRVPIHDDDTGGVLHDRLLLAGREALVTALDALAADSLTATPQPDRDSTYAPKIHKDEARIDWRLPAEQLVRRVRAFNPWPVCFGELDGERVKIWRATAIAGKAAAGRICATTTESIDVACGEGLLRIDTVQLPGGRALPMRDVLNARAVLFAPGKAFTL